MALEGVVELVKFLLVAEFAGVEGGLKGFDFVLDSILFGVGFEGLVLFFELVVEFVNEIELMFEVGDPRLDFGFGVFGFLEFFKHFFVLIK